MLEPSAGRGALARLISQAPGAQVFCVEVQEQFCHELVNQGFSADQRDFLSLKPRTFGQFDRIVMNPPFDGGRDIDHVVHALKFLAPGGKLASVMSAGVEFREDTKTADFRKLVKAHGGHISDLPPESMVVLSGYHTELYDRKLRDWTRREKVAFADGAKKRREVLWLNPQAAAGLGMFMP